MEPNLWFWFVFNAAVLGLLLLDLGLFGRKDANGDPLPVPVRTALLKSAAYALLALGFFAFLWTSYGPEEGRQARALEFLTGYVIEWSLSVDNIFVFVLIFARFGVPPAYQHRVLLWGILGALTMRAAMILLGTALMREFDWIMVIFGLFLGLAFLKTPRGGAHSDWPWTPILETRIVRRFTPAAWRRTHRSAHA